MPWVVVSVYSPVKARSVPASRSTLYSIGVSWARHSASDLTTLPTVAAGLVVDRFVSVMFPPGDLTTQHPSVKPCSPVRHAGFHGEDVGSDGDGGGARGPGEQPGPGGLRADRPYPGDHQARRLPVLRSGGRTADAGDRRATDRNGALAGRVARGDAAGHRPAGPRGGRLLPEATAQRRTRLRRDGRHHVPEPPDRRRALSDRAGVVGLGRADGGADLPSLAGPATRRRSP